MASYWDWFNNYACPQLGARINTFRKVVEHLDKYKDPIIVETGCVGDLNKEPDLWRSQGCSTILFDEYVSVNGGRFYSVDIDHARVVNARNLISINTEIHRRDSVLFLKDFTKTPHLLYLDSYDVDWMKPTASQVHHFNELMAIMPKLTPDTLVVVDDTHKSLGIVDGKGGIIARYADEYAVPMVFIEEQAGWQGFNANR